MHNRENHAVARARATLAAALLAPLAIAVLAALLAASTAHAVPPGVTYAGVLSEDGVPYNGTVDVSITIFSAETFGVVLYAEEDPHVLVTDGNIIIDVGRNGLDDSVLDQPDLFLEISIDGDLLTPRTRLLSVPFALRAIRADKADTALVADALGDLAESDVVTQDQLVALHLDQPLAAGAGISIDAGTVAVAPSSLTSSMLSPGAVDGAAILDGSVTGADLAAGAVGLGKIAPNTITRAVVAGGASHRFVVARPSQCGGGLDVVSESACTIGSNGIFCSYTCATTVCRRGAGDVGFFDGCAGNTCNRTTPATCTLSASGGNGGTTPVNGGVAQFGVTVP